MGGHASPKDLVIWSLNYAKKKGLSHNFDRMTLGGKGREGLVVLQSFWSLKEGTKTLNFLVSEPFVNLLKSLIWCDHHWGKKSIKLTSICDLFADKKYQVPDFGRWGMEALMKTLSYTESKAATFQLGTFWISNLNQMLFRQQNLLLRKNVIIFSFIVEIQKLFSFVRITRQK